MTPLCRSGLFIGIMAVVAVSVSSNYVRVPVPQWIADPAIMLALPAIWLLFAVRCGVRPRDLGLGNPVQALPGPELIAATLVCIFIYAGSAAVNTVVAYLLPQVTANDAFEDAFVASFGTSTPAIVYGAFSAAFFEEVMLRGALGFVLVARDTAGRRAAYVLASVVLSTILHIPSDDALTVVTGCYIGFVAPLLYLRYRTLWPLIVAHFSWDAFMFWWFANG